MFRRVRLVLLVAFVVVPSSFAQISYEEPLPILRDTVKGEIVNFETLMAKPILVTEDGQEVVVTNEADNRLVVLDPTLSTLIAEVPLGQGLSAVVQRPGTDEIWVTLRHQMCIVVIDMNDWVVTHMLRANVDVNNDVGGDADTPGGIVFSDDGAKAYVPASSTNNLNVYDANGKAWLYAVPLSFTHNGIPGHFMNEPFLVARIGGEVFVVSYRSGNQTLAEDMDDTDANRQAFGILSAMTNLKSPSSPYELPDFDIAVVRTIDDTVDRMIRGVGTVLHGVAAIPGQSMLVVAGTEARNGDFIGEGSFANGRVAFNRLTFVDTTGGSSNAFVITENLNNGGPGSWENVVQPTDIAFDQNGRMYVAGYGSENIGVFDTSGGYLGLIPTDPGPLGLAYSSSNDTLYCFNRAADSVTGYDLSSGSIPSGHNVRRDLTDPTFDRVREGRIQFLDPTHSAQGTASCASCHAHGRNDGTSWDLSKYYDDISGYSLSSPPSFWKDRKGVMQTQDLRSIEEIPGYHWRAEQVDLEDFQGAFVGLLKGSEMDEGLFAKLKEYVFSIRYPANPFQYLDRERSPDAEDGAQFFMTSIAAGSDTCNDCHSLPTGSGATLTDRELGGGRVIKTPQLRGLWTKSSPLAFITKPGGGGVPRIMASTGTGFLRHGQSMSFENFILTTFQHLAGDEEQKIVEFVREFDSGVPPSANFSAFLDANGGNTEAAFLVAQAESGHCDLAVRGWIDNGGTWIDLGYYYEAGTTNPFVPSDSAQPRATLQDLEVAASNGARWQFYGVPVGSAKRVGVDRDRDGVFDHDEITLGYDPLDPDSDGDGFWDGYDDTPLDPVNNNPPSGPPLVSKIEVEWATSKSFKVTYETDVFSPSRIEYGPKGGPRDQIAGEAFLPTDGSSNHWKTLHTVFVRLLEEDREYEFDIVTQGQNDQRGRLNFLPRPSATTLPDVTAANLVVSKNGIQLNHTPVGNDTLWTATVTIVDEHGVPVPDAIVWGTFTTITAGSPTSQTNVVSAQPTDAMGVTTITFTAPNQGSGDGMSFDVPVYVNTEPNPANPPVFEQSVSKVQGFEGNFKWSLGQVKGVTHIFP